MIIWINFLWTTEIVIRSLTIRSIQLIMFVKLVDLSTEVIGITILIFHSYDCEFGCIFLTMKAKNLFLHNKSDITIIV